MLLGAGDGVARLKNNFQAEGLWKPRLLCSLSKRQHWGSEEDAPNCSTFDFTLSSGELKCRERLSLKFPFLCKDRIFQKGSQLPPSLLIEVSLAKRD